MIRPGFEINDVRTRTRTVVVAGAEETDGRGWVLEVTCPGAAGPAILEHFHTGWTETFEIVRGEARYRLDGAEGRLGEGESVVLPAGRRHVHPWNAGDEPMVYRQTNDFGGRTPEAVDDVLGVFATLNDLERQGRLNARGLPKNPLQFAATLRTLVKHGGFDASAPIVVQKLVSATLGRFAEALGYRAVHEDLLANGADRSPAP